MSSLQVVSGEGRLTSARLISKKIAGHVHQEPGSSVINITLLRECFPTIKNEEDWVNTLVSMFSLVSVPFVRFEKEKVLITMPVYRLESQWVVESLNELLNEKSAV